MLSLQSKVKLANGVEIPRLGLGVYQSPQGTTTRRAVKYALSSGYRHVDTASLYGNEEDVGIAVRESGLDRNEVFKTTKVWNSEQGYDSTLLACEGSLRRLGSTYVDLYLIHWPVPTLGNETWRAMVSNESLGVTVNSPGGVRGFQGVNGGQTPPGLAVMEANSPKAG